MFAALRYRPFALILLLSLVMTMAIIGQEVLLGYELYRITHDPLVLGLLGLAEAIPFMALALFGGHLADRFDRRKLMLGAALVMLISSAGLAAIAPSLASSQNRFWLLVIILSNTAVLGLARGIFSPALSSVRAQLLPKDHQASASAWISNAWQSGMLIAPVLAGFGYEKIGLRACLWLAALGIAISACIVGLLPDVQRAESAEPQAESVWASIRQGFEFVMQKKILFYSIFLDLVAVLFGGVIAILPAFATDILHVGPQGLGWLRTAPGVGAVLTMLVAAHFSPTTKAWRNMLIAVVGFGLATLAFALSKNLYLSMAMLALTGAFDAISVVVRQFLLNTIPPDHIRGRVVAVNSIFVSASNEIGAFESGVAAKVLGLRTSVLAGASLTLLSGFWLWQRGKKYQLS
jgi:MFS family permease